MLWYHDVNQILSLPTGIYPHGADKRFAEGWAKSLLVYWDCGNDNGFVVSIVDSYSIRGMWISMVPAALLQQNYSILKVS